MLAAGADDAVKMRECPSREEGRGLPTRADYVITPSIPGHRSDHMTKQSAKALTELVRAELGKLAAEGRCALVDSSAIKVEWNRYVFEPVLPAVAKTDDVSKPRTVPWTTPPSTQHCVNGLPIDVDVSPSQVRALLLDSEAFHRPGIVPSIYMTLDEYRSSPAEPTYNVVLWYAVTC